VRIGAVIQQRADRRGAWAEAFHVGDERRAPLGEDAVGVDTPGEPLRHKVGVAALRCQVKQLLKAPPMLRIAGHAAKVIHNWIVSSQKKAAQN
jgi:hypothetical protein